MGSFSFDAYIIPKAKAYEQDGELYIEVPISGVYLDRQGDIISKKAGDKMINQLKSGTVPLFSNHGIDKNGNKVYDWKNITGKWIDGWWADNGIDIVGKAKINKDNEDGLKLFKYVKNGMPVGFSIGGNANYERGD